MSISTSFLRPPGESESRAERARRKQTQRDGMHKQGVAPKNPVLNENPGSCFGLFGRPLPHKAIRGHPDRRATFQN